MGEAFKRPSFPLQGERRVKGEIEGCFLEGLGLRGAVTVEFQAVDFVVD